MGAKKKTGEPTSAAFNVTKQEEVVKKEIRRIPAFQAGYVGSIPITRFIALQVFLGAFFIDITASVHLLLLLFSC